MEPNDKRNEIKNSAEGVWPDTVTTNHSIPPYYPDYLSGKQNYLTKHADKIRSRRTAIIYKIIKMCSSIRFTNVVVFINTLNNITIRR